MRKLFILLCGFAILTAAACDRTEEGKVVLDTEEAEAEVEEGAEKTAKGLRELGEKAGEGLEAAGEKIEAGAERMAREMQPVLDDAGITARVKSKLLADPEVSGLLIDVDTVNGVVTLNGRAENEAQRAEAEKLARGTDGVREVRNLIQLPGAAAPPEAT